ncbi:MAG: penicillin-binding protein activator LpoB [Treponema sp.]|nr:penicillin-binding protein activator LpoB [Treponema sp.]
MKKILFKSLICIAAVLLLGTCSNMPKVNRVSADTQIDLSGRWNDTDVRMVCESLINDCLASPRISQFIQQYASQHNGMLPAVIVGTFSNQSSEHIDTSIISVTMESTIVNSGKLDFVAGGDTRAEVRNERQDQQSNASEATASNLGYETGAALLLTGAVRSIVDRAGNMTVRSYFVNAEMTSIETNTRLWMGSNSDIKKVIQQPNARF